VVPIYEYNAASGYDTNGNVLAYTDTVMGTWSFSYDQLNRLVTAANGGAPLAGTAAVPAPNWAQDFCWAYDSFGNRQQQSNSDQPFAAGESSSCAFNGTAYQNTWASYNAQNQITGTNASGNSVAPSYDAAGDVVNDSANQYLYDAEGRICAVSNGDGATGYLYDAAGNRVAKGGISTMSCDITTNGFSPTAGYVVGPSGEQLTEVDAADVTTTNPSGWAHTNVYAGGKLIGTYDGDPNAPSLHFHFDDPLGTRRVQTDSVGNIEQTYLSLPYGEMPVGQPLGATENHYTGKERDTESGNDYMFARYYNSATGRFLSPDWSAKEDPVPYAKLDNPQTLNLYAYVGNNPIVRSDPDGHAFGIDDLVGALAGAAVGVGTEVVKDLATGQKITSGAIAGAAVGGALMGDGIVNAPETLGGSVVAAAAVKGAAQGFISNGVQQLVDNARGNQKGFDGKSMAFSTVVGGVTGGLASKMPTLKVDGITAGRGNMQAVAQGVVTKIENGTAATMSLKTAVKGAVSTQVAVTGKTVAATYGTAVATSACKGNNGSGCK
jgi:RHS repeat-associated protein